MRPEEAREWFEREIRGYLVAAETVKAVFGSTNYNPPVAVARRDAVEPLVSSESAQELSDWFSR